eukprot:scaffold6280_cov127-Skeletonema_marinoi.AAC.1
MGSRVEIERCAPRKFCSCLVERGRDVRRREGQEMDVFSFCFRSSEPPMSNGGIRYVQCRSSNLNTSKMDNKKREK